VRDDLGTIRFLGTEVVKARPELKQWGVGSPARIPLDQLVTQRGTYEPFKRMRFDAHYPVVSSYARSPAFGYYLHLADPLQFRQFSATVAVSPFDKVHGDERLHLDLEYQTPNWKLTYWHNHADVYDLAGPVLRSRKGDAFIASYTRPLIYDPPRQLDVFGSAAAYFGLEQLPGAQNIPSPKDLRSAEVGLRYTNTTKALGGALHRPRQASQRAEHLEPGERRVVRGGGQVQQHHEGAGRSRSRTRHPVASARRPRLFAERVARLPQDLRRGRLWRAASVAQLVGMGLCERRPRLGPSAPSARLLLLRLVPQQLCR
jgi:hypothetical protein